MPLSPAEQQVLASLERQLRAQDPEFVAVFDRSSVAPLHPIPVRHVLPLAVGLGLVALAVLPGWVTALAFLVALLALPRLVVRAVRWAERRRAMPRPPSGPTSDGTT